jgi:hypothetical protein
MEIGHIIKGLVYPSKSEKASCRFLVETHIENPRVVFCYRVETIEPL